MSKIPLLTLPTSDYEQMRTMNNRRLILLLRSAVLSEDRAARFSPRPPRDHDAYVVRHESHQIRISLCLDGKEIFHCIFVDVEE